MGQQPDLTVYDKQMVALGRILQTLREEEDVQVLIETILGYLKSNFDYSLIWLAFYDRMAHRLFGKGGVTPAGNIPLLKQRFTPTPGDILEQVVIEQRPVGVPDLAGESRIGEWRKVAQQFNIQGTLLFPIRYQDRCFGLILLGSQTWGIAPSSEEKARLAIVLGELGATLNKIETQWQQQQTKHPEEPLLKLLGTLRTLPTLGERFEAIVEETHQFIAPTRTNIYWFERERRYFWRRVSNRKATGGLGDGKLTSAGITAHEAGGFYQALLSDQVVSVGEAHSSLRADITERLMQRIRARSLLAAPILLHGELLGFLSVEGSEARIWEETEKNYIRGAAQLVGLISPLESVESAIEQTHVDRALTAEITHAIFSDDDWKATLTTCAERLSERLKVERFVVLMHDADQNVFHICYQNQPYRRQPIASPLDAANDLDWQMLEQSSESIGIENLEDDLRLMSWRESLLELGVRSLLLCHTAIGHPLEAVVMVAHETPRTWNHTERDLLRVVSQQIGLILHQWHLQQQTDHQKRLYQTLQWGMNAIQQSPQLEQLEHSALQYMAQMLQVPLAVLVAWLPGRQAGRVIQNTATNPKFSLNTNTVVPIYTDTLMQWALQTDGILALSADDLPVETRQWLSGPGIGQIMVMALRTAADHEPIGIVIAADHLGRQWSDSTLDMLEALANQLAWSRRHIVLTDLLHRQREELKRLNWYKHRRLEEACRSVGAAVRKLSGLSTNATDGNQAPQKEALTSMRYQQILRQLGSSLTSLERLLKEEQWKVRINYETLPLASLLRRSLERIDAIAKQRRLWYQVHNEANLDIGGDIAKIELILYEVLLNACQRSQNEGRLDIWCRPVDDRWLELAITDYGTVDPQLMFELEEGRHIDLLNPSTLDRPPGLHLLICQALIQQAGGELSFSHLEDGRVLSRLMLPVARGIPLGGNNRPNKIRVNSSGLT